MRRWLTPLMLLMLWQGWGGAQKDILRDIIRALREPKPAAELLARSPITVVANDEALFNLFRSFLPPVHSATFIALSDLSQRAAELTKPDRHLVILVDRSRGDFPLEHRQLVPYELTLVRRQDVVVAAEVRRQGRNERARIFISAPSFRAFKEAVERFVTRKIRELRDLQGAQVTPVPIGVVITNAGQNLLNEFAERTPLDFVWATPDNLAKVQDLLVTETEIYLLVPPVLERLRERLPFNLNLLAPHQSVAVRKGKGGNYWQVLLYGAFPDALRGLIRRYADPLTVPEKPLVITHPAIPKPKRLLLVPFGDINIYRDRIGNFAAQVFRAFSSAGLAGEIVVPNKPPEPLLDWQPFQSGLVESRHIAALAKDNAAELVVAGQLTGFDTQTVRRQELSSRPSPAADRRIWEVATVRIEQVTACLRAYLYDGRTGETLWTRTVEGTASKRTVEEISRTEASQPPLLEPERRSFFVSDERLYAAAATAVIAELLEALRTEIYWLPETPAIVLSPTPSATPVPEGIVGRVETLPDGTVLVYLDIGANQGLKVGDILLVYRQVTVKTERKTVQVEEELGKAKVIAVFPEACKAQMLVPIQPAMLTDARARLVR
ncbi:MAG: hypothetical protein LKKZDAJK_001943 [Candidatus Fervidibacter sp.]